MNSNQKHTLLFETETNQLIYQVFKEYTTCINSNQSDNIAVKIMKQEINILINKYHHVYLKMIQNISFSNSETPVFIDIVAKNIFIDNVVNWGRIVSLITFGIVIAQQLKLTGHDDQIEFISTTISSYLINNQQKWLIENNAWTGFIDFFSVNRSECSIKTIFTGLIVFIGLGAVFISVFNF